MCSTCVEGLWGGAGGPVRSLMTAALVTDNLTWEQRPTQRGPSHVSSRWTPGAGGLCTATTTRTRATGQEENQASCFSCFGSFFFFLKILSVQSCVWWAETFSTFWWWTFDGVICCLSYLQWCIFSGPGLGGQRLLCGRVISLVYRVNMLFIADVIIYYGGPWRKTKPCWLQESTWGEMICQMDGTETSDTFSLFLY